jgi:hypothetical protein
MAGFIQKHEKIEVLPISTQTTTQTPAPSIFKPTDEATRVYTSPTNPTNVISQPLTSPAAANSSSTWATSHPPRHEKRAQSGAVFESQPPTESPAPSTIVKAFETRSETSGFTNIHKKVENSAIFTQNSAQPFVSSDSKLEYDVDLSTEPTTIVSDLETPPATAGFTENSQKVEKSLVFPQKSLVSGDLNLEYDVCSPPVPTTISPDLGMHSTTAGFAQKFEKTPIFTQKPPESPVLKRFSWADDSSELPMPSMAPTKQFRDLSGLRSSIFSKNPFLSLQRRRQKFNKNRSCHFNSMPQYYHHHTFSGPHIHFPKTYHQSQHPFSVSLDWDQDPRLSDLSNALKALGWILR